MMSNRCKHKVNAKNISGRVYKRKCYRRANYPSKYCKQHFQIKERRMERLLSEIGICYRCKEDCNPASQVCGRCARQLTW
jgi:hypothetical protein